MSDERSLSIDCSFDELAAAAVALVDAARSSKVSSKDTPAWLSSRIGALQQETVEPVRVSGYEALASTPDYVKIATHVAIGSRSG